MGYPCNLQAHLSEYDKPDKNPIQEKDVEQHLCCLSNRRHHVVERSAINCISVSRVQKDFHCRNVKTQFIRRKTDVPC